MKNYKKLSEKEIEKLVNLVLETKSDKEEIEEILSGTKVGDFFQGVRGFVKGESFGFFKYLSKIKNRSQKVIKELEDISKFMDELKELKQRVNKLSIAPEKKMRLMNLLDYVMNKWEPFFPGYEKALKEINLLTSEKLSGQRLDVIPGSKRNQMGSDYSKSADDTEVDLDKPEMIDVTTTTTTKKPTNPLTNTGETKGTEEKKKEENLKEEINRFRQLIK